MWICLNDAFFSIVASDRDPALLNVRARRAGDLERYFAGWPVHAWRGRDYPYRVFAPRDHVAEVLARRSRDINYANFKASVADGRLHSAYIRVWLNLRDA
jgi:hypothetical protein